MSRLKIDGTEKARKVYNYIMTRGETNFDRIVLVIKESVKSVGYSINTAHNQESLVVSIQNKENGLEYMMQHMAPINVLALIEETVYAVFKLSGGTYLKEDLLKKLNNSLPLKFYVIKGYTDNLEVVMGVTQERTAYKAINNLVTQFAIESNMRVSNMSVIGCVSDPQSAFMLGQLHLNEEELPQ